MLGRCLPCLASPAMVEQWTDARSSSQSAVDSGDRPRAAASARLVDECCHVSKGLTGLRGRDRPAVRS